MDGNWGMWSAWSECNRPCGYGNITRRRICNKPSALHGGEECYGPSEEHFGECNTHPCPSTETLWFYVKSHFLFIKRIIDSHS